MDTLTTTAPSAADIPAFAPPSPVIAVKTRGRSRLPWPRILAGAGILAVAVAATTGYLRYAAGFESTDDAFLQGDVHPVSTRIDGTVVRVLVDDNQHVAAGQALFELDPSDLRLDLQASEAGLAQARANEAEVAAQIARARAGVAAAAARAAQNAAQLDPARIDFRRAQSLLGEGAISQQEWDAARAGLDAARAAQTSLASARDSAGAGLAAAQAQEAVARAEVEKAEASVRLAKLQVAYTVVRAPSAGRVAKKTVEVGQRLQPGQPVMAIVSDQVWVVANFKENQLARLRRGERAEVSLDAAGGRTFPGLVDSFSPGTGAEFSLLPPDNATGNFTKIVQRLPVKILLVDEAADAARTRLSPGLSADVRVIVPR
jgi:membrane fusion protein, multidrug efflux system